MRGIFALFMLLAATLGSAQESSNIRTAVFAGGCFWCMEPPYDKVNGVLETTSGYSGGHVKNPTYDQVSAGGTGHAEAIQITYDANKVSYSDLLRIFWHNIDPFDAGGQFCDRGGQYRSEIFYSNEQEKELAEASKKKVEAELGKKVVTQIQPVSTFYPAEAYHQNYYQRNPLRYKYYRFRCGRDQRLKAVWG
ncbi:peptide-methionine (S)-S-oxide reductase MsrA [Microbulbifer sp. 2205BS26-8]|uniref:peptide-methionine (S)-S-oxide reductase MsrA n=1 Tax=Microbulbifer sp. 2205BS26-8 TaxID=3064386 RepID=UPI00273F4C89|nr:peptide-methionine (S)-S-oxide reductase MsrA [Microbulbifer sp. 2205BS26-8]MDP5209162.1 peptide-methionine (S)-S-oxide reductase MsrA [Microbulbifer sp. 2205BS26-8]